MSKYLNRWTWGAADYLALLASFLVVVWLLVPSRLFIVPVALSVGDDMRVTFARSTPYGQVLATWFSEVRNGEVECYAPDAPRLTVYQAGKRDPLTVSYQLDQSLMPCVAAGGPFVKEQTHRVKALGLIPLRASTTTWVCPGLGKPCARSE